MKNEGEFFFVEVDDEEISLERAKARELRKSRWWREKIAAGICHYCGLKTSPAELSMDHIVPLGRGGKSVKANLVPSCKTCNNRKKNLLPLEWDEYMEK